MIIILVFILCLVAAQLPVNTVPPHLQRVGGSVPWANPKRFENLKKLGDQQCYESVNQDGKKFLRPMLSEPRFLYCVVFKTIQDDTFFCGYLLGDSSLDLLFADENTTTARMDDVSKLKFKPMVYSTAEFCRGLAGCNNPEFRIIDGL